MTTHLRTRLTCVAGILVCVSQAPVCAGVIVELALAIDEAFAAQLAFDEGGPQS